MKTSGGDVASGRNNTGCGLLGIASMFAAMALASWSCRSSEEHERLATKGPMVIVATAEYAQLIDTLAREFAREYPDIRPAILAATTREAIVALLNDSVSTVFTDRPMNVEELSVADEADIGVGSTRIAFDALVAVVHAANTVPRFTLPTLSSIVRGEVTRWSSVAGAGRTDAVEFVTTGRNTGLYELIQQKVSVSPAPLAVYAAGRTQSECVTYVAGSERAFTLVSLTAVRSLPPGVRVVPVEAAVDSAGTQFADVRPAQMSVYTGEYPLRFELALLTTQRTSRTGVGFATWLLRTQAQKIVQNAGLVPDVIPTRVIQLTSE